MATTDPAARPVASSGPVPARGLFHDQGFRCLFGAAAVSESGTQIGYLAMPLTAVLALRASPGQVGLLATFGTLAFLLIGLPAGAWADRMRKRPLMIAADLVRAVLFGSVPLAWLLRVLTIYQLYGVVLVAGMCTVFFDVAAQSHLPHLVGRDRLGRANAHLVALGAVTEIGGRGMGGLLVALVSAPVAIGLDAATYLSSAVLLRRVRRPEPRPGPAGTTAFRRDVAEGVRYVLGHAVLRPILLAGTCTNLAIQLCQTMLPVLFVRLGLSGVAIGVFFAVGGAGTLLGSLSARPLARRLGPGRVLWLAGLMIAPTGMGVALVDRGPALWIAAVAWLVITFKVGVDNVIQVSFRQAVTPDRLLGRMNATMRFVMTGALALGGAFAGLLGQCAGVRAALWAGAALFAVVWVPAFFSPLRTAESLPD